MSLKLLVERSFMEDVSFSALKQLFGLDFHDAFLLSVNVFEHDYFLHALSVLHGGWYFVELDKSFQNIGVFLWNAFHLFVKECLKFSISNYNQLK